MNAQQLEIWSNHFDYHASHPRGAPPGLRDALSAAEGRIIATSIATFQLGEQSEGRTFLRAAERFAEQKQLPHLVRIVDLVIREEQRHAALLLAFMRDHRLPPKKSDWTDRVFRWARRLAGLQLYLCVLISAELIGIVYYRALESVTQCERLRVLCRTFVADEFAHVGFESWLLLAMRAESKPPLRMLTPAAHRLFLLSTALVVWFTHRSVLRRAGHDSLSFLQCCGAQYEFYLGPPRMPAVTTIPR